MRSESSSGSSEEVPRRSERAASKNPVCWAGVRCLMPKKKGSKFFQAPSERTKSKSPAGSEEVSQDCPVVWGLSRNTRERVSERRQIRMLPRTRATRWQDSAPGSRKPRAKEGELGQASFERRTW